MPACRSGGPLAFGDPLNGLAGLDTGSGTVQGKYFNKIIADLRKHNQGTTLDQVLDWIGALHGYLSSPTGGGIRHGTHLKSGIATKPTRRACSAI